MITEKELDGKFRNPMIRRAAAPARTLGVVSYAADNRTEDSLANWIVTLTRVYVRHIGGASNPMVEKVWTFANGKADIDMRIGVHGFYKKFKITTEMSGPASLVLRISSWNKFGQPEAQWIRYGAYRGGSQGEGIETLPVR